MTSGSEKRVRFRHLTVRLNLAERAAIDYAAEKAGMASGSYVRQTMLRAPAPRQVRRPPVERKELARLLAELGKIGSNLNQIARGVNTGVVAEEAALGDALAGLRAMRDAVLTALGREP